MMRPISFAESFISDDGSVIAVRAKDGDYNYYVTTDLTMTSTGVFTTTSMPLGYVDGVRERIASAQMSILNYLRRK